MTKKELCPICQKPLTDISINKAHGSGNDAEGNSYHLDPCWYKRKKQTISEKV